MGKRDGARKTRDILTEKWESEMALEKRDLPSESGNVDAYVCDILTCITLCDIAMCCNTVLYLF